MTAAPLPPDEKERLRELWSYDLLDTADEEALDEIVEIASMVFDAPIALISLIDRDRQYFKARVGMEKRQTHRDLAFCAHTILQPDVMVVEDASRDERFASNALVTESPRIRFYAGAPLVMGDGYRIGTLCVIDTKPRAFSSKQRDLLQGLSRRVISELRLRCANARLRNTRANLNRLFDALSDGVVVVDRKGQMTFADGKAQRLFDFRLETARGYPWDDVLDLGTEATRLVGDLLKGKRRGPVSIRVDRIGAAMEVRVSSLPDSSDETALMLEDVTELVQMRSLLMTDDVSYGIVGRSRSMRSIIEQVEKAAPLDIPVVVSGETGTGKELVARALHEASHRRDRPFIAINCGALSESLLGSQLFGHRRGAFTGAIESRIGIFESAAGGTVFLDEVGDMPLVLQVSLLRVLDSKEIHPVGETQPRAVDFRLVCASNRPLPELVQQGLVRADLYYRIRGLDLQLPALRRRREDIPLLVRHFARIEALRANARVAHFTDDTIAALMDHSWPGNVRELRSAISFAIPHSSHGKVRRRDLPPEIPDSLPRPEMRGRASRSTSRSEIQRALTEAGGNRSLAARVLGISRATLYRRLRLHEIGMKKSPGGEGPDESQGPAR